MFLLGRVSKISTPKPCPSAKVGRVDYQLAMAPGRAILDKFANADWELSEALCKECPREAMGGKEMA